MQPPGRARYAESALTLRLALATLGLLTCGAGIAASVALDAPWFVPAGLAVVALITLIDIAVVMRRRRRERVPTP
jgi:hypothetical protein